MHFATCQLAADPEQWVEYFHQLGVQPAAWVGLRGDRLGAKEEVEEQWMVAEYLSDVLSLAASETSNQINLQLSNPHQLSLNTSDEP